MKIAVFGNGLQVSGIWLILGIISLAMLLILLSGLSPRTSYSKDVLQHFDEDFLTRAGAYQRSGLTVYLVNTLLTWLLYGAAILFTWRYFSANPHLNLVQAAGFILLLLLLLFILSSPLDYYRGFVLEHRFGLSAQDFSAWLSDYVKSGGISLTISWLTLFVLYTLIFYWPDHWWVAAGIFFTAFMLVSVYLSPLIIDPLFYKFEPLQDEEMHDRIQSMASNADIRVDEVLVADASRKTGKVNAYFTGIGKSKRIVLYDTLLSQFSREEALAVIAHEMGHWRYNHIYKSVIMASAGMFLAFFLFNLLISGAGLKADIRILPLALLFFSLISFVSLPANNAVSRHFERQADREAVRLTENPSGHVTLFENLARANLSEVEPHPGVSFLLYSHPPLIERIRAVSNQPVE